MRKIIDINEDFRFGGLNGEVPRTLPTDWETVTIPHTWNAKDGQDGGNDYVRGTYYYAKNINRAMLPAADHYYLEIGAANSSADVYWNGEKLMHHDGGYSLFRVELCKILEENLLVIAVDNAPNETVYPQVADFTFYGGLYRGVKLIGVAHSHFALDYYGGIGMEVTPQIVGRDAHLVVKHFICYRREGQMVHYEVCDREGKIVCACTAAGDSASLVIHDAHRWHGKRDPYLYTVRANIIEDGNIIDTVETRIGCRTFEIDPDRGFLLNGEEYPLRGVSRHQDRWGIGNALLPEHHREDMELICELGATTVRLAHYQHDEYFYDLCDEKGIVAWAEIPYISRHMNGGWDNTISQMKELVIQNYHHPSIIVWGLSNEITMNGDGETLLENHRSLNDLVHHLDPTRKTAIACVSMCKTDHPILEIPDAVAYNHYFGWYGGDVSMNGPWFDAFHEKHPNIPIGCSEYGCEGLDWHTSDPAQGDYTEEYQAYYHEELIRQLYARKYLWATYVWNMFDFGADARCEGGENGQNHKGLITFDRKYKKDSFYAYKAWLSDEPFVHICGKRYTDRAEDITRVTVYSNLAEVELFANGVSLGKKKSEDHFFYFDVPNVGETKLIAAADGVRDESILRRVDVFPEKYRLQEKNAILNWFDVTEKEGFYSLKDKISHIFKSDEGKRVIEEDLLGKIPKKDGVSAVNEEMLGMLGGFTPLRLSGMLGMLGAAFTKEELLALNEKLSQIEKPME